MDIDWHVALGSVVKLRIFNDPKSFHPMQHPIHLHGQRMLVVSRDGVPTKNLVWKDTVLIPVGSTVDLLIDASNPGAWMLHCHIAEHLGSGMMAVMHVDPASPHSS
jgi:FtsP/CotA-like multicopper oxidase with cupredoxin domain